MPLSPYALLVLALGKGEGFCQSHICHHIQHVPE